MSPRKKQLFCLFCLKRITKTKKEQLDEAAEITESLFNSCYKHLPSDIIGNSKHWGWEDFKRNNGPFCSICLQSAQQLTTKNELVMLVEKEMQNFVNSLTLSIQNNRGSQVNTPFMYNSNVEIQIKTNANVTDDSVIIPTMQLVSVEVVHVPACTEINQEEIFDCYGEEIFEAQEDHDPDDDAVNVAVESIISPSGTPRTEDSSQNLSLVSTAKKASKTPILKKITWKKEDSGEVTLSIPCECGLSFENEEDFDQHKFSCPTKAPMETSTENTGEVKLVRYRCGICGFLAKEVQELSEHKARHTLKNYICNICGEKFKFKTRLTKHIEDTHPLDSNLYKCTFPTCKKFFKLKKDLHEHNRKRHMENTHIGVEPEDMVDSEEECVVQKKRKREYICEECGKIFGKKNALEVHIFNRHKPAEKPFECHVCQRKFKHQRFLDVHLQTHSEIKNFLCVVEGCGKYFPRDVNLQNHIRLEHSDDHFKCNLCGHKTLVESKLKVHVAHFHDKNKPFECNECFFRVSSLSTLKNHERIHTGEQPYSCKECGDSFRTTNLLKIHNNMKHSGPEGKFKCPNCDYVAGNAYLLSSHTIYKHSEERPFSCRGCGKSFTRKNDMTTHEQHVCKHLK